MINEKIIQELSKHRKEPEWLLKRRLEAFRRFQELPLPSFRYGLHILLQPEFDFEKIEVEKSAGTTPKLEKFKNKFATLPEKDKFFL